MTSSLPHSKNLQRPNFFHFQNTAIGNYLLSEKQSLLCWFRIPNHCNREKSFFLERENKIKEMIV